jgi:pSer/pThr/pTyr-binding forkhead associated (FHA) protein
LTLRVTSDDKCKEGMIYVIEFRDKKELKIGRVPECDVKLKDISVSR